MARRKKPAPEFRHGEPLHMDYDGPIVTSHTLGASLFEDSLADAVFRPPLSPPIQDTQPTWDPHTRTLSFRGWSKRYRRPADNHEDIWEAFQAAGWPPSIPTPFVDNADKHKHTLRSIRQGMKGAPFQVFSDGTGGGVCWKAV